MSRDALYGRIYDIVRQVPPGRVATYGQVARIVGCTARVAGYAMAAVPAAGGVPWQRVVNAAGAISVRSQGGGEARQRRLLKSEGIAFDRLGRIDLAVHGWDGPGWIWLERHGYDPSTD